MAVHPDWQGGRASARTWCREGLDTALGMDWRAVVSAQRSAYYGRFGFRPASDFGLHCITTRCPRSACEGWSRSPAG